MKKDDCGSESELPPAPHNIGAHVSAAGGLFHAFENAKDIGAGSMALFLRSQRKWDSPPLSEKDISSFKEAMAKAPFPASMILPHGSYLINLANPDPEKRSKSKAAMLEDLRRCEALGIPLYNFHPGSTVGECTVKESIGFIAEIINELHKETKNVCVLLETMAGQGNCVGNRFEDLRDIIASVKDQSRVGICVDTCHIFAAGYDIRTAKGYEKVMADLDRIVGLNYVRAFHLNDSKTPLGSGKDRHENIGKGHLGLEAFRALINDERFFHCPMVLETPVAEGNKKDEMSIYREEIELLLSLRSSKSNSENK